MAIFILTSVIHFVLQFIAWGFAPGNTAKDLSHSFISHLWPFLSFPIFWIFKKGGGNFYFWMLFLTNSIIWGLTVSFISVFIKRTRG